MSYGLQALVVAMVAGVGAQWFGQVLRIPALIPLLFLGIFLGPQGAGLIPLPSEHLGPAMNFVIKLGVAVILFEGGLSLNLNEVRLAPRAVRNLLTIGALITFLGGTLLAHTVAGLDWQMALLFGSVMIVTGPTVIVPLLKNLRLVPRLHTVLLWEGILIDAVGVIAAFVTYELVLNQAGVFHAGTIVLRALVLGPAIGIVVGSVFAYWLRWRTATGRADNELDRLLALAGALTAYGLSEMFEHEAGIAAVTVAGMVMGRVLGKEAKELKHFKGILTTLLVSVLFVLLAADFNVSSLVTLGFPGLFTVAGLMLLIRPLNVWISTANTNMHWREKVFLGWIGPRGIVAMSVVSLFALVLRNQTDSSIAISTHQIEMLQALTFATILGTVLLNGLTAKPLAWLLKLQVDHADGILIVGVNQLSVRLASIYKKLGFPAVLVDTNQAKCEWARELGLRAIAGNALDVGLLAHEDLAGVGSLVALTPSPAINKQACVITAKGLNLVECYTVLPEHVDSEDWQVLKESRVQPAFDNSLNLQELELKLMELPMESKTVPVEPNTAVTQFPEHFLPLVVRGPSGLCLYSPEGQYPQASEYIGIHLKKQPLAMAEFAQAKPFPRLGDNFEVPSNA